MGKSQEFSGGSPTITRVLWCGIALAALGLAVALVVLLKENAADVLLSPEEAYEAPEPDAQPYPGSSDTAALPHPDGEDALTFVFEERISVDLSRERVGLLFANPSHSQHNVVIALHLDGVTIAQSRRITSGYCVTTLPLLYTETMEQGIRAGQITVYCFDPDTGTRLMEAVFPVTVTVN
ncbi:MAG: hypothetical protein IJW40_00030 [Clostridia bacterium]|nr:hypothetical protein [Clostridia bacterium]